MKKIALLVIPLFFIGCDTIIKNSFTVEVTKSISTPTTLDDIASFAQVILNNNGMHKCAPSQDILNHEEWRFEIPNDPPGFSAWIIRHANVLEVRMMQDPFGNIDPTKEYLTVKDSLLHEMIRRYGREAVHAQ